MSTVRERTYWGHSLVNDYRSNIKINGKVVYDPVKRHTGIDVNCVFGTELSLPIELKIVHMQTFTEMGVCAFFEDPWKNILIFAHLSEVIPEVGTTVLPSAPLVKTGNSGTVTTNPHEHFEIIALAPEEGGEMMTRSLGGYSGYNIDPVVYLDRILKTETLSDLEWHLKHFPEIPESWLKTKADNDPTFLRFSRLHALRMKEWFGK